MTKVMFLVAKNINLELFLINFLDESLSQTGSWSLKTDDFYTLNHIRSTVHQAGINHLGVKNTNQLITFLYVGINFLLESVCIFSVIWVSCIYVVLGISYSLTSDKINEYRNRKLDE